MQNIKFIVDKERGTLIATDTEVGIRLEVPEIEVTTTGAVVLPVARFGSILRESSDEKLSIESDGASILVQGTRSKFKLSAENPDEFPDVTTFAEEKYHEVPAHHLVEEYVDDFFTAAGISGDKNMPLFRTLSPTNRLSENRMHRTDVLRMIKRRAKTAGLSDAICCHTWRATGITAYLSNGGSLEHAMQIAAHESARTTKLYDRTNDEVGRYEIERIRI